MLQTFTLKNGIKVATYSLPSLRSVALNIGVKGGSLLENKKNAGISHYMEHLLIQGTPSYPTWESLSDFIESIAGNYNASTGSHSINFWLNAPATYIEDCVRVASEVMFQSLFPEEAIERERSAITEEIRQKADSLSYKLGKFHSSVRYKSGHPYRLSDEVLGVIAKLSRQDLINQWAKYFIPDNTYLVIVGGVENKQLKELVEKYFNDFNSPKTFSGFPDIDNGCFTNRGVIIRSDKELKSCYIDLTWPSLKYEDDNLLKMTQSIIRSILTGLSRSRLHRLLRQKEGLVYGVSSGGSTSNGFGSFYVNTDTAADKLDRVVELIAKEMIQIYQTGPTKDELDFAKEYAINRTLMTWDHPSSVASWIEDDLMWLGGEIETPETHVEKLKKIDGKLIREVMDRYWDLSKLLLVIQGPIANSKKNRDKYSAMLEFLK